LIVGEKPLKEEPSRVSFEVQESRGVPLGFMALEKDRESSGECYFDQGGGVVLQKQYGSLRKKRKAAVEALSDQKGPYVSGGTLLPPR